MKLQQLQALLHEKHGAQFISLITITPIILRKEAPYKGVRKISVINGLINFNYSANVNARREKEDKEADFVAQPRKWGTKAAGVPFVHHVKKDGSNELYLEMRVIKVLEESYKNEEGNEIRKEDLQKWLREKSEIKSQGLDEPIKVRDYNIKNIIAIKINNNIHVIET